MESLNIKLDTVEKINTFCRIVSKLEYDVDVVRGRYIVDGKSILGLHSLDLTKPVEVVPHCHTMEEYQKFVDELSDKILFN